MVGSKKADKKSNKQARRKKDKTPTKVKEPAVAVNKSGNEKNPVVTLAISIPQKPPTAILPRQQRKVINLLLLVRQISWFHRR